METVYIETSIFSYLTAKQSRNIIAVARQQLTIEWWEEHRHKYALFTSNAVIAEASQGDINSAKARLESLRGISIDLYTGRINGGMVMKNNERDEIIEELWAIKDNFSISCHQNVGEIVKKMNKIAADLRFKDAELRHEKKIKTS